MSFKDFIQSDLDVFLDVDEFGEIHKLGGKDVVMIVQEDSFIPRTDRNYDIQNATQNLFESVITIFLKASDYKKPAIGKRITLDDEKYYVVGSTVSDGILKISLTANESYG